MKQTSWRTKLAKSEKYTDDFINYKIPDSKGVLPNRGRFTGDEFPSSGDPAKVELNAWHRGSDTYKKDKKVEEKGNVPSPILVDKNRREFVSNNALERRAQLHNSTWRKSVLTSSNVEFEQSSDGAVKIDVTTPENSPGIEPDNPSGNESDETLSSWRGKIVEGADADIDFKKSPDGTMILKVKHNDDSEDTNSLPSQPVNPQQTTPNNISPTSPTQQFDNPPQPNASLKCSSEDNSKEWVIRQNGSLSLVGRECNDKVGIFILKTPSHYGALDSKNTSIIDSEVLQKNGKLWRELINESVWISKFERYLEK